MKPSSGVPLSQMHRPEKHRRRALVRAAPALVAAVQMLTLCSIASRASAAEVDWKGNHSADWFDDKNWKPSDLPDNHTSAIIDDISHDITVIDRSGANTVRLIVGDTSVGVLSMRGSGALNAGNVTVGNATFSLGTINLNGPNVRLTDSGGLFLGDNGAGRFTVSNGSLANLNSVLMSHGSLSSATITVDRARFIDAGGLTIGETSRAAFNIQAGSDVTAGFVTTAQTAGTQAGLSITSANLTVAGQLVVGSGGASTLSLSGGAILNANAESQNPIDAVVFGQFASANATVTVTGPNSELLGGGDLVVGKAGIANVTLSAGGFLSAATLTLASQAGSTGTINIGAAPDSAPDAPGSLSAASIVMGNGTATINLNHTSTALPFSPAISGNGTVNVIAGTTIFLGNSNYSGSTNISPGATLQLGGVLGNTTSGAIISGISDNGHLIANRTNTLILPGLISGIGSFLQLGTGTTIFTVNGNITYAGTTTISAGYLLVGNATAHTSLGTGAVIDNSVLAVNRYDIYSLANPISGTGQFTQVGIGITALAADNTFTGNTTISAGVLQLGANSATGSVVGNITDNSVLAVLHTNNLTLSNFISGTGQLQQLGIGTTVVTANNTFSGLTTISAGSLQLGNGSTSGRVLGNINDATILSINRTNALTLPGTISGTGQLLQFGTGTTILTANNTYSGTTTITAGILQLGDGGATGSVAGAIIDNSILALNRSNILTLAGSIAGTGQLQQLGIGTTILAADNTYTGTTAIATGTLQLGNAGSAGSFGTGAVTDSSVLAINHTNTFTLSNNISGTGQLFQIGAGATILTADDTYTGNTTIIAGILQLGNGGTTGSVVGDITDTSVLTLNHSNNITFSNVVSGTGQLQQLGTGTTTLTANNSFTGLTTISAGTLQLGNGSTSGSVVGGIRDDATLSINHSDTVTLSNAISGVGQFTQIGTGTTILAANNSYTGLTTISAGTLQLGDGHATGSVAGAITVNSILASDRADTLTLSGTITGAGQLRQLGPGTTILAADNNFTGTTIISAGTHQIGNGGTTGAFGRSDVVNASIFSVNHSNVLTLRGTISGTGEFRQLGTGTTILIADSTYTGNTTISAGTLQLGDGNATGSVVGNITDNSILVLNHTNFFTLGNLVSGTGQVEQIGTNFAVLTANNTYTGLTTISAGGIEIGAGSTSGSVVGDILNNGILTANHVNTLTLPGTISGTGSFSQLGTGTTILSADNTYTGGTEILAGTLQLGDGHTTGSIAGNIINSSILVVDHANTLAFSGVISGSGQFQQLGTGTTILAADNSFSGLTTISAGVLQLGNAGATGSLGSGAVLNNTALSVNRTNALTLSNAISGTGEFLHLGPGTTVLTADNTYTGNTTISAGTLQLGNGSTTGAVIGEIINNGTLAFNHSNAFTLPGLISGTGQLQQLGTGTTILTANNTLTGTTTISAGTLQLGNGGISGSSGSGNVIDNSVLAVNRSNTRTLLGVISGTGQFMQLGTGTTIISAENTYTGTTTISAGALQLGDGGTTGSVASNITDNSALNVNRSNTLTLAKNVSGTGQQIQLGTGTTILTADNTFTGLTTISAGILQLGDAAGGGTTGSLGSGAVLNNTALSVNRTNTLTLSNAISGTGEFLQLGSGTTILTADNTYTGNTTISAGTLQLGNGAGGGTTGSVTSDITNNGILAFNHSNNLTLSNAISGTGQIQQLGTGTTILTANNTLTGTTTISAGTLQLGNGGTSGSSGSGAVINNAILALNRSDTRTLPSTISGTGQFTQLGTGTTILTANNTYTGNTTISAGTLQLGDDTAAGSVAGNIANNANLTFHRSDDVTFNNVISGTGNVTKLDLNTLTFTANQTYTGLTRIDDGTLVVNGSMQTGQVLVTAGGNLAGTGSILGALGLPNTVEIADGGQISPGSPTVAGTLTTTSLILAPTSQLNFQLGTADAAGSPTNDLLIVNGNLTLNGQLNITGAFGGPGTYRLINYTGSLTDNGLTMGILPGDLVASSFLVQTSIAGQINLIVQPFGTGALFWDGPNTTGNGAINGGTSTWNNTPGNTNWTITDGSVNSQWNASFAIFDVANGTVTVDATSGPVVATGMQFAVNGYTVQGSSITLNGDAPIIEVGDGTANGASFTATIGSVIAGTGALTLTGLGTLVLTAVNTYAGGTIISQGTLKIGNGGTTGSVSGPILNDAALVFDHSGNFTFAGLISGNGTLTKLGAGTLILTANNTVTGLITISAGTLQVGNGGTTGSIAGDVLDHGALVFNRSDDIAYDGVIVGNGTLTKLGAGTLTLTGENTYTGLTTISAGTLQIGNAGVTGSIAGNILNDAALLFNRSNDLTYAGVISGNGTVTKLGDQTLTLTGANTYTGLTTISNGTLQVGNGGTTGSIAGNIADNASLVFNRSDSLTYAAVISGNGTMTKLGAGTLTLTGANTLTGGTTISNGALQIGDGGTTGSITGPIEDEAALIFNHSNNITFGAPISGAGTLTKLGAGTLILTADNTYTGLTTISSGALQIGNNTTTGSIVGNILDQASLIFNRSDNIAYDGAISGNGTITKIGAGTLTLTGDSTFTGLTTITTGTLQIGNAGISGNLAGNILNNAALIFNRSNDITYAGVISGNGTVTKLGDQTLTLTGNNTYTGPTTVSAGILQIGNGGTTGSIAANIVDNASLVFNRSDSITYAGVISGTGSMTKLGAGTLTLAVANTFTGGTTVAAGALQIGSGGTTGSITGPILDDSALILNRSNNVTFAAPISGDGTLTKLGAGTLILTGNNTFTGLTTISAGTLQVGNGGTTGSIVGNILDNASLVYNRSDTRAYDSVISGNGTFTKLGAGTLILTGDNTFTGLTTISTGTLQIGEGGTSGSVVGNILNNAALAFNRTGSLTYAGAISGTGTVSKIGDQLLTLTGNNTFTGLATISNGTLQIGNGGTTGSVAASILDNASLLFNRSNTLTYAAVISGNGSVTKLGTGTLILASANAFIGGTTISAGTLQIGNGTSSGSVSGSILNNAALVFNRSNDIAFGGVISGNGTMTKLGAGTLTLTGANSLTGGTTISAGALQVGNGGAGATLEGNILDNAALLFNHSSNITFSDAISGSGNLTKLGAGTLILTGAGAYTGGTTVSTGTLQVGAGGATGSIVGAVLNNAVLAFDRSDNFTFAGVLSGTGALIKLGDNTLTLAGINTFTGTTTVSSGTLQIGSGNADTKSTGVAGNILNHGALLFNRAGTLVYSNVVSGSGSMTKLGTGTLILTAANAYTGGTSVSAGTLQIGNGGNTGSISGIISDNSSSLVFNRSNDFTFGGVISGNGTTTKRGPGTLTFTGQNAYTGLTTVSAGALQVGNGGTSGTIVGDILDNASLLFNRSDDDIFHNTISGSGSSHQARRQHPDLPRKQHLHRPHHRLRRHPPGRRRGRQRRQPRRPHPQQRLPPLQPPERPHVLQRHLRHRHPHQARPQHPHPRRKQHLHRPHHPLRRRPPDRQRRRLRRHHRQHPQQLRSPLQPRRHSRLQRRHLRQRHHHQARRPAPSSSPATTPSPAAPPSPPAPSRSETGVSPAALPEISSTTTHSPSIAGTTSLSPASSPATAALPSSAPALTLTGDNTFTGRTILATGTLQLGNGGTTGSVAGPILDNASLLFNRSNDVDFNNVISGTGTLTKLGAGTLDLTADNTYTGLTTISTGTLEIGNGRTITRSSGSVVGDILNNAALVFNRTDDITYRNIISGSGSLTQQGDGELLLTARNTYTGPTFVRGGILQVNGSISSDTTVEAGGTLAGTGTIFGNVQNHGLITPGTPGMGASGFAALAAVGTHASGATGFGALTLTGNYVGSGGQLVIRGAFGGNDSPTDQLVLSGGHASGVTPVDLVNVGGKGALTTGSGIPIIVTKNGATTSADAFALAGGSFVVGNFTYALVQGANDNWFLSSAPESPEIKPPPVVTGFRPEASLYSIVPAMSRELGVISIGTFHERQGDQSLLEQGSGWVPAAWGRVIGEHTELNWSGTVNPSFDGAITGFQAGLDLYAYQEKGDDRDHFGLFAAYANALGDVSGLAFEKPEHVGHMDLQATSAGIYYTHVATAGWYIDAVGMGSWYNATPSSDRGLGASIDGAGMTLSLEAGYPFKILPKKCPTLVLEPEAQVFYQYSSYGAARDNDGSIHYDDSNTFAGRLGGRLQIDVPIHHMLFKPYALANLWQNFATTDHLNLSDSGNVDTKNAATSIEMGLGLTAQITKNIALYGGGSYVTNLDSNNQKTFFGDFGLRVTW